MQQTTPKLHWKIEKYTQEGIKKHAEDWQNLLTNSIEKNTFLAPWFAQHAFSLYKDEPFLVTLYTDDLLIGLLPVQRDFGYAKLPVSFYKIAIHLHQFLGTPLVRKGYEIQFSHALYQWIDELPKRMSFFLFNTLSANNIITDALENTAQEQSRPFWIVEKQARAAIFPSSNETSGSGQNKKLQSKNIQRRKRKLEEHGHVSVERLSNRTHIEEWYSEFLKLENKGWKKELGTSIEQNNPDKEFFLKMLHLGYERGQLNFFRLKVNDRAIAYTIDILSDEFVYCLRCAYDQEFRKYGPGAMLEYEGYQYYTNSQQDYVVDSCTAPDNQMLNAIFPHKKKIATIAIGRKGFFHQKIFSSLKALKTMITPQQSNQ